MSIKGDFNIINIGLTLGAAGYFIYNFIRLRKRMDKGKLTFLTCTRFLVLILLAMSLFSMRLNMHPAETMTVFLVDKSLSNKENLGDIECYINGQISNLGRGDSYSVVSFGMDASMEIPETDSEETVVLEADVNGCLTDFENALRYSAGLFPKDKNRRLVLMTDGRENVGDVDNVRSLLEEQKINLFIMDMAEENGRDVQLVSIFVPDNMYESEKVPVAFDILSGFDGEGQLYLYRNGERILEEEVRIDEGRNRLTYIVENNGEGNRYRGEILFQNDENPENNTASVFPAAPQKARVLVLGEADECKNMLSFLESSDIENEYYSSNVVPSSLEFLTRFHEVVMVNTDYGNVPEGFFRNLEMLVRNNGTGLMVVGGDETFALGNYEGTDLEDMLPVTCRMKGRQSEPDTGIILAIDVSGSMKDAVDGVRKIDMAKEAAIRSIERLEENDCVGVLAFSDTVEWIVPYQRIESKDEIMGNIGKLEPRGGTLILPALGLMVGSFEEIDTKVRHVILLSDGQAEQSGYEEFAESFKENNITMSFVAVGEDADRKELEKISDTTGGRSYYSVSYYSIPDIFAKETCLATKKYLNNEEFTPVVVNGEGIFDNIDGLPALNGYMGTGIRDGAVMILQSSEEDPVLASWQYGLGRVIVWTSDLDGFWISNWIDWSGFDDILGRIMDYGMSREGMEDIDLQIFKDGNVIDVYAAAMSDGYCDSIELAIHGPDGESEILKMNQVMADKYYCRVELTREGDYLMDIEALKKNIRVSGFSRTASLDYSPEYSIAGSDAFTREALVGADFIEMDDDVFSTEIDEIESERELYPWLMPLILLLFIADIAIRKI